ncbi:hypothetical protein [Nocardioides litoris]|uniref:hypothetical protein n=1 Tax=Nocardioides litoris TaxID=1926648 RepID=UPI001120AE61|nr:hypothetical protein [Nocardioides litoris]
MGPDDLGYSAHKRTSPPAPSTTAEEPLVALRLATTYADRTRHVDVGLRGRESVVAVDGEATTFPTERLWPVLRDLLPPLAQLRADPRTRPAPPDEERTPGPGFVDDCRALVAVATVAGDEVTVRTWLATDDELWSVEPRPDGTTRTTEAPAGALADLLVWDVTAALEALVLADRSAS